MSRYLSLKISILYTILIFMVILIHSQYQEAECYPIASFIQKITTGGICRIANCLFFCISGYLFARSIKSLRDIFPKIKKRFRTLLIPYLIWNIIFALFYVLLDLIPIAEQWNNNNGLIEKLVHQSVWQTIQYIWLAPAAFQLWFLRDLIVMVLFTPILWIWAKKHWITALIAAILSIFIYNWLIYFWIGIIIATQKINIENYYHNITIVLTCTLCFTVYAIYVGIKGLLPNYIEIIPNIAGIYLIWYIYDYFALNRHNRNGQNCKWLSYICGYSFFIYLSHEPVFNVIKKLTLAVTGINEFSIIILFFINPLIMFSLAIIVAKALQHVTPSVYKILTGGR